MCAFVLGSPDPFVNLQIKIVEFDRNQCVQIVAAIVTTLVSKGCTAEDASIASAALSRIERIRGLRQLLTQQAERAPNDLAIDIENFVVLVDNAIRDLTAETDSESATHSSE